MGIFGHTVVVFLEQNVLDVSHESTHLIIIQANSTYPFGSGILENSASQTQSTFVFSIILVISADEGYYVSDFTLQFRSVLQKAKRKEKL
jgi:hypothetical protein